MEHESIESFTPRQNDRLHDELVEIVKEHNKVIELCQKMSRSLAPNVLIHFITSALITCICCLMIMLADGAEKLIFVNYIVASTTQIFVYSFGGSLLVDASQRIEIAAYNFHWYKCNAKVRSLILMIMIRAQKKTGIDVPFFEASLETFMSVS